MLTHLRYVRGNGLLLLTQSVALSTTDRTQGESLNGTFANPVTARARLPILSKKRAK